jgi:hypothetical protein
MLSEVDGRWRSCRACGSWGTTWFDSLRIRDAGPRHSPLPRRLSGTNLVSQDRSFRNQRPPSVNQTPAARALAGRKLEVSAGRTSNLASGFVTAHEHPGRRHRKSKADVSHRSACSLAAAHRAAPPLRKSRAGSAEIPCRPERGAVSRRTETSSGPAAALRGPAGPDPGCRAAACRDSPAPARAAD